MDKGRKRGEGAASRSPLDSIARAQELRRALISALLDAVRRSTEVQAPFKEQVSKKGFTVTEAVCDGSIPTCDDD